MTLYITAEQIIRVILTLQELDIRSPISGELATGTGTDAIAVICGEQGERIDYCGKHTRLGEVLARLVIEALSDSVLRRKPLTQF